MYDLDYWRRENQLFLDAFQDPATSEVTLDFLLRGLGHVARLTIKCHPEHQQTVALDLQTSLDVARSRVGATWMVEHTDSLLQHLLSM